MSDWSHALTTAAAIAAVCIISVFTLIYAKEQAAALLGVSIAAIAGLGGYHVARCVDRQKEADRARQEQATVAREKARDA